MNQKEDFLTFLTSPTSGTRTPALPIDFCLLITDTLESPGIFLQTHFIHRASRDQRKCLLVGFSQGLSHYSGILKKNVSSLNAETKRSLRRPPRLPGSITLLLHAQGIQLANEQRSKRFDFVDGSGANGLGATYQSIAWTLDGLGSESSPLVLIDDLSSLLWRGNSSQEIARFFMAVRALVTDRRGSIVVLLHADDTHTLNQNEDVHLFRRVLQQSDLWLQVTSLSSQTRGELSIHRGPALVTDHGVAERSGPTALIYKLDESGATFSLKGLGKFM